MNAEPKDPIWEALARALFSADRMDDEFRFRSDVMRKIRQIQPALQEIAWHRFLRWAIPALGVGAASLVLAARTPVLLAEDPVNISMEDF